MATLYQIHSTMDTLRRSTHEMALTWRAGDSILLLGSTAAFIDWLNAYINDVDMENGTVIKDIAGIYVLAEDVAKLSHETTAQLKINNKVTAVLTDSEWVTLTQDTRFDKVVTIAL
ncbi:hypothetical protein ES754_02900 [Psychrobacter frigidicola]|uniref:Sulfurtransferase complex subunit TusB n=1 Tax=Psychrobacter frigidicola TaxID=45611 RepID=A0A5C7A3E7_9GAMM|nr:hypothetical protein [Psychrobacter frigidicola]TXD97921.1 hypothetical protein ES754_02900 [Psychrobacter frigidicola]